MRAGVAIGAFLILSSTASTANAQVELKNDNFTDGGVVNYHGGFVAGEIGAARFVAPGPARQLLKVRLLFGPNVVTRDVTLKVWDDTAGTTAPGTELHTEDFQVPGSPDAIVELDVTASNVIVTQQFRIGIVFTAAGPPSIADDTDGLVADRNFLFAVPGGWFAAGTLGVGGDWVIRAEISGGGGGGTPDAAPGGGTPDAAGGGGGCNGNTECSVGEYCDVANHVCTFDCRADTDCSGGDTCSSLGQCVTGGGGGGGGCATGGNAGAGGLVLLGLGLIALLSRTGSGSSRSRSSSRP